MTLQAESISLLLILLTFGATAYGFSNRVFYDRWTFQVGAIRWRKEYGRLFGSGFLHVDWMHFIFNMFTLYSFGQGMSMSGGSFLLLYLIGMLGGNLLSLYLNRNNDGYRAVGASGAVSAIIMYMICLNPFGIKIFGLIPGVLFGILFILGSIFGIQSKRDNIGHEAHLGGAFIGIIASLILNSGSMREHLYVPILLFGMIGIFLALVVLRPEFLIIPPFWKKESMRVTETIGKRTTTQNSPRFNSPEEEINFLLDKGIDNLSKRERKRLEDLSNGMK